MIPSSHCQIQLWVKHDQFQRSPLPKRYDSPKCPLVPRVCAELPDRDIEEMMGERGYPVDHSTVNRWVIEYSPQLEAAFQNKKKRVGTRWRMDETYIKVKGERKYFYRAVDKEGNTIDFLLTAKRDKKAALRFLNKAIGRNAKPGLINIDKSGANKAGITAYNKENTTRIKCRQCKYLDNVVEQDHRFIKRITRPMLGFKNF